MFYIILVIFQETGAIVLPSEISKYQEFAFKKIVLSPVSINDFIFFI